MFGRLNRKYFEDDTFAVEEDIEGVATHLPPVRFMPIDYLIAFGLGVLGIVFISLLTFSSLHPTAWVACTEAAGIRAPMSIVPGLWRFFAHYLYDFVGVGSGNTILAFLGKVAFGVLFGFTYLFFRGVLALFIRAMTKEYIFWRCYVARLICALAAFLFVAADPVWQLCLSFSPRTALLVLLIVAIYQWIKFLTDGRVLPAYIAMCLFGLLTAESPIGFLATIFCWIGFMILKSKRQLMHLDLMDIYKFQTAKWYLTFFWVFGVIVGIALNVGSFIMFNGACGTEIEASSIPLLYGVEYFALLTSAASVGGWVICGSLAAMVLVIALMSVYKATDIEYFLGYTEGLTVFVIGLLAYSQLCAIRPLWVWTWIKHPEMVHNQYLLSIFVFFFAMGFLIALAVLSVNLFCRNAFRIAQRVEGDELEGESVKRSLTRRKVIFLIICVVFAIGILPGRLQPRTNRMLSLMRVYVLETIREAGDAHWFFTDGSYDAGFELEAAARGKDIVCLPVFNGLTARKITTLGKYMADDEDRLSAQIGGANILSTWQRDKPARLTNSVIQIGHELWRRSGGTYPTTSGMLSRVEMNPSLCESGVKNANVLMDNILSFYENGEICPYAGQTVRDLFLFMQWRLSRLARVRAEIADHANKSAEALAENEYANKLDEKNESFRRLVENVSTANRMMMRQMTPREGLQFALVRANFQLARHYAAPILEADPDNPDANFGMGMSYFEQGQYSRAEEYLARCLKRNEKEPAVWNNLAVIKLKLGRFEEAKKYAEKALSIIPDSIEVKDTLREVEKAIKQREEDMKHSAEERAKETKKAAK